MPVSVGQPCVSTKRPITLTQNKTKEDRDGFLSSLSQALSSMMVLPHRQKIPPRLSSEISSVAFFARLALLFLVAFHHPSTEAYLPPSSASFSSITLERVNVELSMGRRSFASVFELQTLSTDTPRVDFDNFWIKSIANFTLCEMPLGRPPDFSSKGGSLYWNDGTGVIRYSDHWSGQFGCGMIKDCYWTIDVPQPKINHCLAGRCEYDDFYKGKKKSMKKRQKWGERKN